MFDWSEQRVLVTGASGFVGSWLAEALVQKGAHVSIIVRENSPRLKVVQKMKNMNLVYGDIKDKQTIKKLLVDQNVIFDLAAITQVIYAIKNPRETVDNNITGIMNILECLRESDAFLMYASTDKVYGEPSYLPIDENHPLRGKSPYDASKIAAERIAYVYHLTYGIPLAISRCCNIYGGCDANILRAIPDFITSVLNNKQPLIRGHGEHQRDFMYVQDAVRGLMLIAEKQNVSKGQTINFGTCTPIKIKELAELVIKTSGKKLKTKILAKPSPGEIDVQYVSYEKAKKLLGWKPETKLEEGLKLTYDWYKQNMWFQDVIKETSKFYGVQ